MPFAPELLIFLGLTLFSHVGASLFFAKPRFGKTVTAAIWLIYAVVAFFLPPDNLALNFFLSLGAHMIMFFVTTVGPVQEKGFLFLSYACIYTCISTIFTILNEQLHILHWKIILAFTLIALMQVVLYVVLLPPFRKVTPYIRSGWGGFYAVVLGFFVLILAQTVFPAFSPMSRKELIVFLLTMLAFCLCYTSVFTNMKNTVELSREKQHKTHAELLLMQVQSQAKEAELVRQNRHDMRHHYQMLLSYAECGELDQLTAYLKRQTERIKDITTGRFCENETVNSILKVYNQKATEQNIAMEIRAAAKPTLTAEAPDLVAIVANVLENALHGAMASDSDAPFICVNIKHQSQRFVVKCENSCAKWMDFEELPEHLKSIGIQSITATADKYGGSCRFGAKDGVFSCTVIMDE